MKQQKMTLQATNQTDYMHDGLRDDCVASGCLGAAGNSVDGGMTGRGQGDQIQK
jgi:hypothetical protein